MSLLTRRGFLAGAGLTVAGLSAPSASAIEPFVRTDRPHLRLSLAAYSFRKYLAGDKGQPATMTLEDFIDFAAQHDLDAVELTRYYFPKSDKQDPKYLARLKTRCTRLGLDISGTAVNNEFTNPDDAALTKALDMVKEWIQVTSFLGGKTVRIFSGGVHKGDTEDKARARCVETIQKACDHAAEFGVFLALENHGGISTTADQLLAIVKDVKHDHFGVNLDTGNFRSADPYADIEKLAPYAVNVQVKTEIQRAGQKKEEADLKRVVDILKAAKYRGYVVLEYEAAEDPKTAVPQHLATLRKLIS
jgi:sugar phosphate isomerase/epimerase